MMCWRGCLKNCTARLELETSCSELGTSCSELGTSCSELGTSCSELGTSCSELGTSCSELGTSCSELGTSCSELGTSCSELGTSCSELGTFKIYKQITRTYALKPETPIPPNPRQSLHLGRPHRMIASPLLYETLREGRRPRWLPLKSYGVHTSLLELPYRLLIPPTPLQKGGKNLSKSPF